MKKYELTQETAVHNGKLLYRIKAIKSFGNIKKGDVGGYVEKEGNLSHGGNAWVFDNAMICDNAWIYGSAIVSDNVRVFGNTVVYSNAKVSGKAILLSDDWYTYNQDYSDGILFNGKHIKNTYLFRRVYGV